jgi:hypothetical protein
MKTKIDIEVEISCIENEISKISKLEPTPITEVWIENRYSSIRALKWVIGNDQNFLKKK